jgi:hypothetical protein
MAGTLYTDRAAIQDQIDRKAAKLVYAQAGRPNWLVVHASGVSQTGLADFAPLTSVPFHGPFDRLLAYEPWLGFVDLPIDPNP